MSKLMNALQGKLNTQKSHIKDPASGRQLDLFASLSDRAASEPKFVVPKPENRAGSKLEPEMVLPPSSKTPPDVSADVRAALSESDSSRSGDASPPTVDAPVTLRTGIYQRPRRPAPPPSEASHPLSDARVFPFRRIWDWFAGVEMDRRLISLVMGLIILVALLAFWTARSQDAGEAPRAAETRDETAPVLATAIPAPVPTPSASAPPVLSAPPVASVASVPAPNWKIAGTEATQNGGAVLIRFSDPVFVSADNISVEGMRALKAVAAKLTAMKAGAKVVVTGYTDSEPLSKPTARFQSNADIAAARATVALEHLAQFSRANKGLSFEARTGELSQAPYPNDTPQNRRLNRTATVQVIPAP